MHLPHPLLIPAMLPYSPNEIITPLKALAVTAGEATLPFFRNKETIVIHKNDGSPQTIADRTSEKIILDGLATLTPHIPVIAEEEAEKGCAPYITGHESFWLVDPLDGTKEFIKGKADYVVNIGLVHHGTPVLGVVYVPVEKTLYFGGEGIGAWRQYDNKSAYPIQVRPYDSSNVVVVASDNTHAKKIKGYLQDMIITDSITRGSSLKFCLIAEGHADLYPRFIPTYEWDTVAAHALLLQAGGDIIDYATQQRLQYGKISTAYRNGSLITASNAILKTLTKKPS